MSSVSSVSEQIISDAAKRVETVHSLGERLEEYPEIFDKKAKILGEEVIEEGWFFRELTSEGWKPTEVKRVTDVLMYQDGKIFAPRPGYLKRC